MTVISLDDRLKPTIKIVSHKERTMHLNKSIKDPRFLLLYSPQWFDKRFGAVKPEGSLGIAYVAGALKNSGYDVSILDCCVGNARYSLQETFYHTTPRDNGMVRVGMNTDDILKEAEDFNVIGISSIFTAQTKMVEETVSALAHAYPEKLIILGGVNARSQLDRFFDAGAHVICMSEAETTIIEIANLLREGKSDFSTVRGVAFKKNAQVHITHAALTLTDLDDLPIPAWDILPLQRYWEIARPHGSVFSQDNPYRYASAMTSRGCPFRCHYCHISLEKAKKDLFGTIGALRLKTPERVIQEMLLLKELGVEYVLLEDDSLLGKRARAMQIFKLIKDLHLRLGDVNGINLAHMFSMQNGKLAVDEQLMEAMVSAGFEDLQFPVESGSQRIIDAYATGKLNLEKHDITALIKKAKEMGIKVGGNYTFGYPDETLDEMQSTIDIAKLHMDAGLDKANFMIITPFPGTQFYDYAVTHDLFLPGIDIGVLDWMRPSIKTLIAPATLEHVITEVWRDINNPKRINRLRSMTPR